MAVYVDPLFQVAWGPGRRYRQACHLFANSLEELHRVATVIGLKRAWFQTKAKGLPHYDLTTNKRREAIKGGAISLTRHEAVLKFRELRSE